MPTLSHLPWDIQQFLTSPVPTSSSSPPTGTSSRVRSFYHNHLPAVPSPYRIDELHTHLSHNYSQLESNHAFIQWWFPLRTTGVNALAPTLTSDPNELLALRNDREVQRRFKTSYEIMLDFYGFALHDFKTGRIKRSSSGYETRYRNWESNGHNWLRVSRILKSCSEFGLEHLNAPLLLFILVEQNDPSQPNLKDRGLIRSMDQYWRYCIRNPEEREWVVRVIDEVRKGEREWTETEYDEALWRRKVMGSFREVVQSG
ncbi:BQ2448_1277 [Microbotryum intermedium]|uniref:BQ2448_1277 protein n=1 Tax=Microbotryum intermedium TaxID=269621 RepID=A0A238FCZ6_9BASI|nr:BQ2448_1277 [Microbotryum intermedium]